jgi:hypothetical protein
MRTADETREHNLAYAKEWKKSNPEYQRQWNARNKEKVSATRRRRRQRITEAINLIKSNPCTDCGVQYPPHVMDFDHIEPSNKSYDIHRLKSDGASVEAIKKEISKCELVCANCHREREYQRRITTNLVV